MDKIGIFWLREDFRILKEYALAKATKNHKKYQHFTFIKRKNLKTNPHKDGGYLSLFKILK